MKPLVSIIVPVYNASSFLRTTVDSIIHQTYKNLQIIFVDDGSTDNSIEILQHYSETDDRICILKQKNLYAGVARNNGLKHATGKYVLFLDADDIFEKNMVSKLVKIADRNKAEIVFFGFYRFSDSVKRRRPAAIKYYSDRVLSANQIADQAFQVSFGVPWNKMYNREFIIGTGIRFQALRNNNDEFFTKLTFLLAERVYFSKKRYVNYRVNNKNSLQGSLNASNINFSKALIAIFDEMKKRGLYEEFKNSFNVFAINLAMEALERCNTLQSFYKVFEEVADVLFPHLRIDDGCTQIVNEEKQIVFDSIVSHKVEQTLFNIYDAQKNHSIPKCSIEYRIGKRVLRLLGMN